MCRVYFLVSYWTSSSRKPAHPSATPPPLRPAQLALVRFRFRTKTKIWYRSGASFVWIVLFAGLFLFFLSSFFLGGGGGILWAPFWAADKGSPCLEKVLFKWNSSGIQIWTARFLSRGKDKKERWFNETLSLWCADDAFLMRWWCIGDALSMSYLIT